MTRSTILPLYLPQCLDFAAPPRDCVPARPSCEMHVHYPDFLRFYALLSAYEVFYLFDLVRKWCLFVLNCHYLNYAFPRIRWPTRGHDFTLMSDIHHVMPHQEGRHGCNPAYRLLHASDGPPQPWKDQFRPGMLSPARPWCYLGFPNYHHHLSSTGTSSERTTNAKCLPRSSVPSTAR